MGNLNYYKLVLFIHRFPINRKLSIQLKHDLISVQFKHGGSQAKHLLLINDL